LGAIRETVSAVATIAASLMRISVIARVKACTRPGPLPRFPRHTSPQARQMNRYLRQKNIRLVSNARDSLNRTVVPDNDAGSDTAFKLARIQAVNQTKNVAVAPPPAKAGANTTVVTRSAPTRKMYYLGINSRSRAPSTTASVVGTPRRPERGFGRESWDLHKLTSFATESR
jgi:hypothetical protein